LNFFAPVFDKYAADLLLSSRESFHVAFFGKMIEQEMEVDQSTEFSPPTKNAPYAFVIQILAQPQPTR